MDIFVWEYVFNYVEEIAMCRVADSHDNGQHFACPSAGIRFLIAASLWQHTVWSNFLTLAIPGGLQ
jgi:hypothetical protein